MSQSTVLIVGANGQLGSVLTDALRAELGENRVIGSDIKMPKEEKGPFELLDIMDKEQLHRLVRKYQVTEVYQLAAILSAKGEENPKLAWDINMNGLFNVLEIARECNLKVFFPSSIAVFGSHTPRQQTPQETIIHPETIYGISKAAGENWCQYYHLKYGVDVRSLRYPGVIGYQSMPGGGTTDYAVEIYHSAVREEPFTCFLKPDTRLPMIYMPDAIRATLELMDAPEEQLSVRTSYNLASMSFSPSEIYEAIRKHFPAFNIEYQPDFRQKIAESWSETIDDTNARRDWGWQPEYDLESMTDDMIFHLRKQYQKNIYV
ncbi:NAD-dependent epimerase/dehydratase family protein [Flavilitoribacter nigricans]|uniref:NAD-dependent epimerase n=1 Tax=Flavilitoribacter nigricans (strain ATCC 23147 / DSM 23189 / NBRC 102662 / NCIMB 1420 / SS-2) TaxID=1122177 RepID=A0A2D0NBC9_FLAN2|nr:NAD-dependent epimerase/dehydratase family protein [Flavilitoribacter nigricans]PHN05822.1 NAD-dependent epimerase [Flavilitoribacter nigricans DSM 23189 = NBRC 102662]